MTGVDSRDRPRRETYRAIDGQSPATQKKASVGTAGHRSVHRWVAPTLTRFGSGACSQTSPGRDIDAAGTVAIIVVGVILVTYLIGRGLRRFR